MGSYFDPTHIRGLRNLIVHGQFQIHEHVDEVDNARVVEIVEALKASIASEKREVREEARRESKTPSSLMLSALLPSTISEDAIAGLEEIFFDRWLPRYGERRARWIWKIQAIGLIIGHYKNWVFQIADAVKKLVQFSN